MRPFQQGILFDNALIDRRVVESLGWSIFSGVIVYAMEMVGFILLGDLIGGGSRGGQIKSYLSWTGLKDEHLVVLIFALKLLTGFFFAWVSMRIMKRLLLVLTREVAGRHLAFGKESGSDQADLPSMTRNCLTLIAYLDGNYFRQLSIIIQESILLVIVATYMMVFYGWHFVLVAVGLVLFFLAMKRLTGGKMVRLGQQVVQANAQIVRAINELYRMRKELNVWGGVPTAVGRIESGMDHMMTPNYQSELILAQIRPLLELAAVTILVTIALSGRFASGDLIIIGMFVLRTLPSMTKLQVGMTALSAAEGAKKTIHGVLKWS